MACSGNPILGDPEAVSHVGINGTVKVFKNVRESPWARGWYFRNFWVGMCRWDPGTLNLYQS